MKSLIPCIAMISICASVSFGVFDYTVTGYIDSTFPLDSESLLVNGDGVQKIFAEGSSYVEVQNTLPIQPHIGGIEEVDLLGTSSMRFYNGEIGTVDFSSSEYANVYGGSVSTALNCHGSGAVNVSGGYVELLYVNGSNVTLTGGDINIATMGLNVSNNASITFVCDLASLNKTYDQGVLIGVTGNWLDGSGFDVEIQNRGYNPTSDYITFVPEPTTLALLGLGGLLLRRKR